MLRPMANLFAVGDPDPGFLDRMEERLTATGEFESVWRPAPGWLAGQAPLPESEPDGDAVRSRGFAFVEGRDRLERGRDLDWLDRVAELADRSPHRLAELPGDFGFVRFRPDGTALGRSAPAAGSSPSTCIAGTAGASPSAPCSTTSPACYPPASCPTRWSTRAGFEHR